MGQIEIPHLPMTAEEFQKLPEVEGALANLERIGYDSRLGDSRFGA